MIIEFDNPESVMNSDILSYMDSAILDGVYEPPIRFDVFAKAIRANPMHSSALDVKKNMLCTSLVTDKTILKKSELKKFIMDFLVFGNGYLVKQRGRLGDVITLSHIPALYMRRKEKLTGFKYKPDVNSDNGAKDYTNEQVFHFFDYDVTQELYGLPQYASALTSIWLSEDATLFRRKYFINGSHAGYLLFIDDPNMSVEQEDEIRQALRNKGALAFKNLFFNGRGKGKKPELIPISQVEAKDSYKDIKQQTMADILTCHRIPLELMSVKREGIQSTGDLNKIDKVFYKNELLPLLEAIEELNDFAEKTVLTIKEYQEL